MKILIINGPNLNLLGAREKNIYGALSLKQIQAHTERKLSKEKLEIEWFISNHEGEIVEKIQSCLKISYKGLVINPGGYAHTSVAIHDALKILRIPIVEVHLSQIFQREDFRQTLLTARAVNFIMSGLGKDAYVMGVQAIVNVLKKDKK